MKRNILICSASRVKREGELKKRSGGRDIGRILRNAGRPKYMRGLFMRKKTQPQKRWDVYTDFICGTVYDVGDTV